MPTVREAFKTYHDFASADLEAIYGQRLKDAKKFELNTVETGILINDGTGLFTYKKLPHVAQMAPTFGIVATHFDGDGKPDLVLAQNFYHPQRETGRMNGSLSLVLLGNGDGTYRPLEPLTSGIALPGDTRSATIVDLNSNNRPDVLIARNSDSPRLYLNNSAGYFYKIHLHSKDAGNPHSFGARVSFSYQNGKTETVEIQAASGYLSQSAPATFVSQAASNLITQVTVRWPNGKTTTHYPPITLKQHESWTIKQR